METKYFNSDIRIFFFPGVKRMSFFPSAVFILQISGDNYQVNNKYRFLSTLKSYLHTQVQGVVSIWLPLK